jgi:hypothetical protein
MFPMHTRWRNTSRTTTLIGVLLLALSPAAQSASPSAQSAAGNDRDIANSLAAMLRAGRAVISNNAAHINDPTVGDKGLDGKSVLAQVDALYLKTTGVDPLTMDPASRYGRLLRDEMDAIVEVMDANAASINTQGIGFKGFIPAVFGRLVSEAFSRRAAGEAEMKVTAPADLVRNRRATPDPWEAGVIADHFMAKDWPKGEPFAAVVDQDGHQIFRIAVPEYYVQSCLSCHGGPRGSVDLTGYPKEGANLGDLGGVISLKLAR